MVLFRAGKSLISTGSLVPGARVVEGVLWMAGPANALFALAGEGIASLGSRTREISVRLGTILWTTSKALATLKLQSLVATPFIRRLKLNFPAENVQGATLIAPYTCPA
jgi:hypothetical protein